MEKIIDLLKLKLNGISICSETINFETLNTIPQKCSVVLDNIIKNSENEIVAAFSSVVDNKNLDLLLEKLENGFKFLFFYEDIKKRWL
jgi:hypothetical protein